MTFAKGIASSLELLEYLSSQVDERAYRNNGGIKLTPFIQINNPVDVNTAGD